LDELKKPKPKLEVKPMEVKPVEKPKKRGFWHWLTVWEGTTKL
jgi:hypothetical protein